MTVFALAIYEFAEKVALSQGEVDRFITAEQDDIAAADDINLIA